MKQARFCDLSPGTRFIHRGRVYLKLRRNLARDEARARAIFPTEAEVGLLELEEPRSEVLPAASGLTRVNAGSQELLRTG